MESLLIKVKSLNNCKTRVNYGMDLRKLIQREFELVKFLNSGFFYINSIIGEFESNKEYFFRIIILNKEEETKFAKIVLKNKISNRNYSINELNFSIEEIIYKDSPWAFSYIPKYEYSNKIKIKIQSPCLLKIGSTYLDNIEKDLFFIKAISNYNKYMGKDLDKFQLLENLTQVGYKIEIIKTKIKYSNNILKAFKGEIFLDFSLINEKDKNIYYELISSIKFLGIGDKIQDGMGQAKIVEQ